ncbi:MAG: Sialic acid TRAP transporter permease protein SiaT [Syntrophorhabdus sp. PtaU1.Bin058]|nr:MAG: Sialic acid TRAP transporter permease protein SiaT [Syntrophorhabdus sp. PtaU1.Bin058]
MSIALLTIGIFLLLLLLGLPVAFTFFAAGAVGITLYRNFESALTLLGTSSFIEGSNYILVAIPLFIFMGRLVYGSGLSKELYAAGYIWLGRFRGGLAHATVVTLAFFAACTGSSMASVATMAPIAMPEMERFKYDDKLASGAIASAGTLGILIPPSIAFIVYGYICQVPVGPLFVAGILPGILLTFAFMATVSVKCWINPKLGPSGPSFPWRERFRSLKGIWWSVAIFTLIIGGIYTGLFTPTEAAGMGAFLVFIILLFQRRLTWKDLLDALKDTVITSCMILTIFIGTKVFNTFLGLSGIAEAAMEALSHLPLSPKGIIAVILLAYIPLGCFIDSMPLAILTLPIVFPVVRDLGFDPLWFGVLHVVTSEISLITPPVGMNVYVLGGVTKKPLEVIFRGTMPYLIALVAGLFVLFFFPSISLILPKTMG